MLAATSWIVLMRADSCCGGRSLAPHGEPTTAAMQHARAHETHLQYLRRLLFVAFLCECCRGHAILCDQVGQTVRTTMPNRRDMQAC